jgi:predicted RNA binding protein YcfA (HicA-like mRNA interferase family)
MGGRSAEAVADEDSRRAEIAREDGWVLKNQEGSHRQYVHPVKPGKVTIAGHLSDELDPKTRKSILKQSGLEDR